MQVRRWMSVLFSPSAVGLTAAVLWFTASVVCSPVWAGEVSQPVRGLVVDRSDGVLWLGLPAPAKRGAVFDVMLLPGDKVIARAEVVASTADPPYVAKARFVLEDPRAFIPVGAYVEATEEVIARDRDEIRGFREVRLEPRGVNPLSFNIGAFYPSDGDFRDETGDLWTAFELAYRLAESRNTMTSLSVGYYHREGEFMVGALDGRRDFRVLPVSIDFKVGPVRGHGRCGGYFLVGVGAYDVRDDRTVGAVTESFSKTTFGWKAGLGYESKSGRFAQIKYVDVSESDFKGVVFSLGASF